jgi:hypothetical protein
VRLVGDGVKTDSHLVSITRSKYSQQKTKNGERSLMLGRGEKWGGLAVQGQEFGRFGGAASSGPAIRLAVATEWMSAALASHRMFSVDRPELK